MKKLLTILPFLISVTVMSQTSDNQYQRLLVEVLEELQAGYDVRIKYDKQEIGDFELKYADWRLKPGDFEQSLKNVLAPFDYIYVKQEAGVYKIKPFQYHLVSPEEGADHIFYLKTLYSTTEAWHERRTRLKQCIRETLKVDELPNVADPQVIISGKRVYKGYSIENIALETVSGLYVTGSIYRPVATHGKIPIIISPNGHFGNGRYRENEQLRCAALAKMGALVVSYDLFGWGESELQVGREAHRKSIAHIIQTNNSIKLLDYLTRLKGVDPRRIGITGGSSGGSQAMLVSAIDDRISVSVPVVMTSSFHSGGCPCESGMPIHLCGGKTNNAEIAAIFAPKPMLIISDGKDWTFQVPEVEFPFIKRTYSFYGASQNVENTHFADEGHDYGRSKRNAMYRFMAKHLGLNLNAILDKDEEINESGITIEEFPKLYAFGEKSENIPDTAIGSYEELMRLLKENNWNE